MFLLVDGIVGVGVGVVLYFVFGWWFDFCDW